MTIKTTFAFGVSPFTPMPRTVVKMGRRPNPPPPPGEKTPLGKRAKGYLQTAQSIKEYVTSHPGARSKEMINALGFSLSRIKLVLSKMCEEGLLTKVRDKNVLTTTFLYYTTGADVPPQQKTKREACGTSLQLTQACCVRQSTPISASATARRSCAALSS